MVRRIQQHSSRPSVQQKQTNDNRLQQQTHKHYSMQQKTMKQLADTTKMKKVNRFPKSVYKTTDCAEEKN